MATPTPLFCLYFCFMPFQLGVIYPIDLFFILARVQPFMEVFKQTLRKAVNEAFEQETEMKYRIAASIDQFNDKIKELNPSLEMVKRGSKTDPTARRLLVVVERTMRRVKAFLELRQRAFAEGATHTEETLDHISDILISQQDLHDEL